MSRLCDPRQALSLSGPLLPHLGHFCLLWEGRGSLSEFQCLACSSCSKTSRRGLGRRQQWRDGRHGAGERPGHGPGPARLRRRRRCFVSRAAEPAQPPKSADPTEGGGGSRKVRDPQTRLFPALRFNKSIFFLSSVSSTDNILLNRILDCMHEVKPMWSRKIASLKQILRCP